MRIGETILRLREEKQMTQEEFAQYFCVTRQTISNWEKEKSFPDLQTLVEISDASGISVDDMLRDNFNIVRQIDKKVKYLKMFKIGTAVLAAVLLAGALYLGGQCLKRRAVTAPFQAGLQEMGFEKQSDDFYYQEKAGFRYEIYLFDRPSLWKWNQEMSSQEKFVIATYVKENPDTDGVRITLRKTEEFMTLTLSEASGMSEENFSQARPVVREYLLEKGRIENLDKMDEESLRVYQELQSEIKRASDRMEEMYEKLYM